MFCSSIDAQVPLGVLLSVWMDGISSVFVAGKMRTLSRSSSRQPRHSRASLSVPPAHDPLPPRQRHLHALPHVCVCVPSVGSAETAPPGGGLRPLPLSLGVYVPPTRMSSPEREPPLAWSLLVPSLPPAGPPHSPRWAASLSSAPLESLPVFVSSSFNRTSSESCSSSSPSESARHQGEVFPETGTGAPALGSSPCARPRPSFAPMLSL